MHNHNLKSKCPCCQENLHRKEVDLFDDRYGAPGNHDIYACSSCGFGKTHPGLKKKDIGSFYERYYPISSATPETVKRGVRRISTVKKWLAGTDNVAHEYAKRNQVVLDVGSASGVSLLEIKSLGAKAYGVEPDPNGKRLGQKLGLKVHKGFITDNPFPRVKFNLVTGSQVIEHEPDPLTFLLAIKDKLRKNGRIVLSFPNYHAFYRSLFGRRWIHYHIPYHLNFFTRRSINLLAKKAGLNVVKLRTITPNEWSLLQARAIMEDKPQYGVPSPIWSKAPSDQLHAQSNHRSYIDTLFFVLSRIFLIVITPINRLVDSLGMGESFLVEMVKE